MIKAKIDNTIILGLSDKNMERLKNNDPILFNLKEANLADLDVNVMIFNGRTEESMLDSMMANVGPETKFDSSKHYKIGKYMFNHADRTLKKDDVEIRLTSKENQLLKILCENKGEMLDRSVALKKIWGADNYFNSRSMDVFITKIRKFLKEDKNVEVMNIHGKGFKLNVKED